MERSLIDKLAAHSPEESKLLDGETLDRKIYFSSEEFIISEARLHGTGNGISVRTHTRYTAFPSHKHNYVEMMIVLAGEITHIVEGEQITLKEGDILLLNKHISHSVQRADKNDIGVNIIMSDGFLAPLTPDMTGTVFSPLFRENSKSDGTPMYLHFASGGRHRTQNLIENLLIELTEEDGDKGIMAGTVALLLSCLSKQRGATLLGGTVPQDKGSRRTMEILSYIKDNYRAANLPDLAEKLYLTVPYLSKLIKESFGKSFKELVVEARMERAKELFLESELSIGEIIRTVGYENESYFHRRFKETYGTTPLAMRKSIQ